MMARAFGNLLAGAAISLALSVAGPVPSILALEFRAHPPDVGVSEEFLVKLGTSIVPFLEGRLMDARFRRFHRGVIVRLAREGGRGTENRRIAEILANYADSPILTPAEARAVVSSKCQALGGVGARGGDWGVVYLGRWLAPHGRVESVIGHAAEAETYELLRFKLLKCAIGGLMQSRSPAALHVLKKARNNPPETFFRDSLQAAIDDVIQQGRLMDDSPPNQAGGSAED